MRVARVLLLRHAESTWNALARWQGWGDPPLSERGREQAQGLAQLLTGAGITRLVSSDLVRAAETAAILGRTLGLEPELDPRLRERNLGRWSGLREPEIRAAFADELVRFRAHDPEVCPGGGESAVAFAARVMPALEALAAGRGQETVAVVTHLGVIRLFSPGLRLPNAEIFPLDAASLVPSPAPPGSRTR